MSLIIFTTRKGSATKLFLKEAKRQSVNCLVYFYSCLSLKGNDLIYKGKEIVSVGKKDKIILRDPYHRKDYSPLLRKILKKYERQVVLDRKCMKLHPLYEDRLFQAKFYQKNNICVPCARLYNKKLKIKDFPVIAKKRISSRGKGNFLLKNEKELSAFFKNHDKKDFMVQEYIKAEADYRVLILKSKILGIVLRKMKFKKDKTIRVKVVRKVKNLPKKVIKDCLKISKKLGADFVGVDVLLSQGKYYFLESNLSPQFRGFMRATGTNVTEKIINLVS